MPAEDIPFRDSTNRGPVSIAHPVWRIGYVRALADLEANPNGRCHKILKAIESNDPSPEVRAAATEALKTVAALRGTWSSGSHKRMMLNAWWQIRKAQRIFLNQPVDDEAANLLRLREVRR